MTTYAITGAGRGIGLELTKQLAESKSVHKVFALSRGTTSEGLSSLIATHKDRVVSVSCEVTNDESVLAAAKDVASKLDGQGLDVLVNNVGIMPFVPNGTASMSSEDLLKTFDTNVVSQQRVTSAFLELLRKGKEKKIMNISTTLGSISRSQLYRWAPAPAYKVTKAAMNMLSVQYALDLEKEGFTVLAITPGWLKTDLGSQNADLDVSVGVKDVIRIMSEADTSMNGKFMNIRAAGWEEADGPNRYDGREVEW